MVSYIGIIHKEKKSDFGVSFPDFPGCISVGSSLEEVRQMAQQALQFHIDGMLEDGEFIPPPSSLDQVMCQPDFCHGVVLMVDVAVPVRSKRINITMDESLLRQIDACTDNRSAFLAKAAALYLHRQG